MTFGERLKMLIKEKGIQQQELAITFNLSKQAISGYVNNTRIPNDDIKKKFAKFFNVSVDYLICNTDIKNAILTNIDDVKSIIIENNIKNGIVISGVSDPNSIDIEKLKKALELGLFKKQE